MVLDVKWLRFSKKNTKKPHRIRKNEKFNTGFVMFQPGPNNTLSQHFMKLGLLVAGENVDTQTGRQTDIIHVL